MHNRTRLLLVAGSIAIAALLSGVILPSRASSVLSHDEQVAFSIAVDYFRSGLTDADPRPYCVYLGDPDERDLRTASTAMIQQLNHALSVGNARASFILPTGCSTTPARMARDRDAGKAYPVMIERQRDGLWRLYDEVSPLFTPACTYRERPATTGEIEVVRIGPCTSR